MTDSNACSPESVDLHGFLRALSAASIHYTVASSRPEAVRIDVTVPGERWEIEFIDSGDVWVEVFRSSGDIAGREALDELFERFAD